MFYQSVLVISNQAFEFDQLSELINVQNFDKNQNLIISNSKNSIGIKDIIDIYDWNSKKTDSIRICVIYDAHKLTTEAQNSLLRILEEPSQNSQIILITSNPDSILNTIKSRCKVIKIDSDINKYNFKNLNEFLNMTFREREVYLNSLKEEPDSRNLINLFVEQMILELDITKKQSIDYLKMIESFRQIIKSNQSNANINLILDNLNILFEKI